MRILLLHEIIVKVDPDYAGYEYYDSHSDPGFIGVASVSPP